jgi:CelD/BcsL family acetyltransferase involved in cellulose biosynthesis
MEIIEIARIADIPSTLRGEWTDLQKRTGNSSLFLGYDWFFICASNLPQSYLLRILLMRENGRLVAAIPFFQFRSAVRRIPVTRISLLHNQLSPFCGILAEDVAQSIVEALRYFKKSKAWDFLSFSRVRDNSTEYRSIKDSLLATGQAVREYVIAETPFLSLQDNWQDFYKSKSRKFRMTRRSIANRLERVGQTEINRVDCSGDLKAALTCFLKLGDKGWKRKERADLLPEDYEHRIFEDLIRECPRAVVFWFLLLNGSAIAAELHLLDGGTIYGVRAHYDDEYQMISPGRYLDYEIVERLFNSELLYYDMGPGVSSYKTNWTQDRYRLTNLDVVNTSLYSQVIAKIHFEWFPRLGRLKDGIQARERVPSGK